MTLEGYYLLLYNQPVSWCAHAMYTGPTMEYDTFIKSQLASRNLVQGLMWCKFGHVFPGILGERNPRTPPCGTGIS